MRVRGREGGGKAKARRSAARHAGEYLFRRKFSTKCFLPFSYKVPSASAPAKRAMQFMDRFSSMTTTMGHVLQVKMFLPILPMESECVCFR